jgi:hypothetical protein
MVARRWRRQQARRRRRPPLQRVALFRWRPSAGEEEKKGLCIEVSRRTTTWLKRGGGRECNWAANG